VSLQQELDQSAAKVAENQNLVKTIEAVIDYRATKRQAEQLQAQIATLTQQIGEVGTSAYVWRVCVNAMHGMVCATEPTSSGRAAAGVVRRGCVGAGGMCTKPAAGFGVCKHCIQKGACCLYRAIAVGCRHCSQASSLHKRSSAVCLCVLCCFSRLLPARYRPHVPSKQLA
jgi:hypothetical protein